MAQLLGNVAVGTVLKLNEYGSPTDYIVVHQGIPSSIYDSSCNGTWLLRKDVAASAVWNSLGTNSFGSATLFTQYLPSRMAAYDTAIQSVIKTVKIPYCVGGGSSQVNSGANGYSCKLFLLGMVEVGFAGTFACPTDGAKLSYFDSGFGGNSKRIALFNKSPFFWWTRTPISEKSDRAFYIDFDGTNTVFLTTRSCGIRPAMVMPSSLIVDDSNNITANQLVPPSNITIPSIAMQQQTLPVSWTPISVPGADVTYQLQRNADNGGWTTIYTGADTSYTDTVGTWTQVQYQVATVALGSTSDYTQSSIIPVSDPFVLVISGSDGNLGTLTSNVPYTVSSNTGNQISLTRTVNGAQVTTLTINSGFAYSIPIADLPTGTGTIVITAQVQDTDGETVTATRTWTYYKTPINIPSTGGIAQLTQNGQNIWPITLADCVKVPTFFGGTLDKALELIAPAVNPAVIAVGTYTGNGQFGQSHPNTLTFSKQPLIVIIYGPNITLSISSTDTSSTAYISGTTATWYSTESAEAQLNSSGVEYSYVAIATTNN